MVPSRCRLDASPKCCDFIRTGEAPFQTISVPMLGGLCVVLPVLLLLLRHALLRRYAPKAEASLRDVSLGFLSSLALTQASTNMVKTLTSQPRPNHYALRIYASLAPPGRIADHYDASAWHAFPSGHCSLSMTAALFLTLLFLSDIHRLGGLQHQCRAVLVAAACLPIFLACYIAASRVFDYFVRASGRRVGPSTLFCFVLFCGGGLVSPLTRLSPCAHTCPQHSEGQATCGMLFGGFWAILGFLTVIPNGERPHRPLKWL